jgi:beta-glucanase (GH16 family)
VGWLRAKGISLCLLLGLSGVVSAAPNGYSLYWGDEFNLGIGQQANPSYWTYNIGNSGWGNNELENYTRTVANSHIVVDPKATDGLALQIQAIETSPGVYTSARLLGQGKINQQYGFIEARLRMPYGQGIWPAFWMLGGNINTVGWPACGEADIMENIGSVPTTNWGSLHAPNFNPSLTYVLDSPDVFHTDYHLFQASWTPNSFTFYVDGSVYHSENINNDANWPFNEPMFFILNVAVGGNWPGSPDQSTVFPQNLLVDYVRVYHLTGPTSNEVVSFFSSANNCFVSAENDGASPLDCNRTVASTWEQFLVVDLGSNKVALQSQANGKFVTVTAGSSPSLIANGSQVTPAATFQWFPNPDGTAYLKSLANGKYVTIDTTQNPPAVMASASISGTAEAFGVTCYSQLAGPSAPATPKNLRAKASPKSVVLTWSPVAGATSYMLYHSSLPGGSGMTPLAQISGVSYIDLGVSPKTTYSYAVTALNAQGMSIRTAVVTSKPLE